MKLKNLFTIALSALVLLSCTKEVEKVIEVEKPVGTARIKVGIAAGDANSSSRADNDHYGKTPTTDEVKIYNYALFVFNASGMLEASLIATPYSINGTQTPKDYSDYPGGKMTFEDDLNSNLENGILTVSAGNKTFFAIVNAPSELLTLQDEYLSGNKNRQTLGEEVLDLENLAKIVGKYDSSTDGGVVYFENPVDPTSINRGFMMTTIGKTGLGYDQQLLEETEEGQHIDIELTVGRAMAKVSLASDLPNDSSDPEGPEPYGTLDVLSYKVVNNPKQMYIMPKVGSNGLWTTPYYTAQTVNTGNYFESHNSVISSAGTFTDNYIPVSKDGEKSFTYCIENANLHPKQGNATIAIVKGVFTPGGLSSIYELPEANSQDLAPATLSYGVTFYRIWIPEYTHTTTGQISGNKYEDGALFYTKDPAAEMKGADTYIKYYTDALRASQGFPTINPDGTDFLLKVDKFTEGICYYRVPLYNEDYSLAPYTVKRNSYYRINVTSVSDTGYTDEEGGGKVDPETPLEPQSDIKVTIAVDDWTIIDQPGNL